MQQFQRAVLALALAAGAVLAACGDRSGGGHTAVLGGSDGRGRDATAPAPTDARGRTLPPMPARPETAQIVPAGEDGALAVWVDNGHPMAALYEASAGWSAPRALEAIYGEASDPQVVANATGAGMAVWRHTVGSIESLRFSRYDPAAGWSVPDVLPGALPRPRGQATPPQLRMDDAGNVTARWPSGFDPRDTQVARFTAGQGWSRAVSESVAAAPSASPAPPSPSSAR